MLVFLNGQILNEEEAKVSISDLSYQLGYGLFETIRCDQGIPVFFESHYKRLTQSAKEIGMPFPVEENEVRKWICDLLVANKLKSARARITISKRIGDKFNVSILTLPVDKLIPSYILLACTLSRDPNSVSFRHKTTSRADSFVVFKRAQEEGFNDAVYLNERNELIECTRANIFVVLQDKIITPLIESGILQGVSRGKIIEIAKKNNLLIEEKNVHSLYLTKATDVFVTNAIIGIMAVSKIKFEDKEYSFNLRDSKTISLKNAYDACVQEYLRKNATI